MGALQFHHHQRLIFMTPISLPSNLRATISILSNCFSTACPKFRTINKTGRKIKALNRDKLKEQWLNSLICPPLTNPQNHEGCENGDIISNTADSHWVIGIDPDTSGALAVLKSSDSAQVYDSPNVKMLIGNRMRPRMDTKAMVELLQSLSIPIGTTAYIEQSLPYPIDGKQSWWSSGFNYGLWIGALVTSGVSVVPVSPKRWKQEFKLSGNKDDSRALACSLFPTLSSSLKRKKDDGRAEALLIAAYGKGIRVNSDSQSLMNVNAGDSTS